MTLSSLRRLEVKMGCGSSSKTAVHPLTKASGDQNETGSKLDGCGDSAVSKVTTDSGVVMESRDVPTLPSAVPDKLHPLTSESVRESEADRVAQEAAAPGLLQGDGPIQERAKSSEILEELLSQGIIPVGESKEKRSGAAYSIMLDERGGVMQRPPARLESLKARKAQSLHSKERFDERMRLVEERRKLKEDERKTRLRTMSARVRRPAPISSVEEDEDASLTPVESLRSPFTPDPTPAALPRSQIPREAADGGEWVREPGGDGSEEARSAGTRGGIKEGGERRDKKESGPEDGDAEEEEEATHVEELKAGELLTAVGDLESDSSFLHTDEKDELF